MTDSKAVEAVARMIAATVFPRSASCLPSPFDAATGQQKRQLMDIARTAVDEHLAHLEAEGMVVVPDNDYSAWARVYALPAEQKQIIYDFINSKGPA